MNIRFTSTLTPEDENQVAPVLLRALTSILDLFPIAYVVRIDTSDSQVYLHSRPTESGPATEEHYRPSTPSALSYDS